MRKSGLGKKPGRGGKARQYVRKKVGEGEIRERRERKEEREEREEREEGGERGKRREREERRKRGKKKGGERG